MLKNILCVVTFLVVSITTTVFAGSSFQYTCSNIQFAYDSSNNATIEASCLQRNGIAKKSSLILRDIGNQNGRLVQGSGTGPSTFQQSSGNIQIIVDGAHVTLSALCRKTDGSSVKSTLPLDGIHNDNGNLTY